MLSCHQNLEKYMLYPAFASTIMLVYNIFVISVLFVKLNRVRCKSLNQCTSQCISSTLSNFFEPFFCPESHEWLLSDTVDILPHLLLPLAGPEEFPEDDMEKLPPDLQYLDDTKQREPDPDIRMLLLDALLQVGGLVCLIVCLLVFWGERR